MASWIWKKDIHHIPWPAKLPELSIVSHPSRTVPKTICQGHIANQNFGTPRVSCVLLLIICHKINKMVQNSKNKEKSINLQS